MTNLSDFLKVKKVRCVSIGGYSFITVGKEYDVVGVDRDSVFIVNDDESEGFYSYKHFEPVLDSAENPLQNIELTPEFEAVEPKFKVGDRVYCSGFSVLFKVLKVENANGILLEHCAFEGGMYADAKHVCRATPENYELLSKLYPHIKFEAPPKPLSGDELVKAMLTKGIKNVLCLWVNGDKIVIDGLDCKGALVSINNKIVSGLTPIDWCTGNPLTESILND